MSTSDIRKIDLSDDKNLLTTKNVNLGYACRSALAKLKQEKIKELEILQFRNDCRKALKITCEKLLERSPLNYKLAKGISFLDPSICQQPKIRERRFV